MSLEQDLKQIYKERRELQKKIEYHYIEREAHDRAAKEMGDPLRKTFDAEHKLIKDIQDSVE